MRQRGSSVLEILVATAISVTGFLAIVSFCLATLRFGRDMDAQAALQRQGSAIAEELGRRLRQMGGGSPLIEDPANPPDLPACLPLPTTDMVLVIPNPSDGSNTCVYRSTDSPPQIVRCTRPQVYASTDPCTPVANLLDGSLVALSLGDQRGSTLVMGLMLVFIMTLLGAALFNVAQLDARLKLDSQTGVQALEIAEAGLERGLHLFYLEFVCGPTPTSTINLANCANPPTDPNYIPDNSLPRIPLATDCPAGLLPDGATGFHVLQQDQSFAGGTYTVCVRQWPDPNSDPPNQPSSDQQKAQFRSLGVLSSVTGTVARIVQIDATAAVTASQPHAPFSIGRPTSGAIKCNAVIAGPVQFLACPGVGCVAVEFGGGGGLQNNYDQLDSNLRSRIPMLFPNGTPVSTLGAVLKVKEGLVKLSG